MAEELKEHAEHGAHNPFDKKVAATMAVLAAMLALVAVMGHLQSTEELLSQQKASDQWAFYQAKSIRRYESEITRDVMALIPNEESAKLKEKYGKNAERYREESDEIQRQAKEFEHESVTSGHRAVRFHFGEIFIEIAIVLSSLAILTKRELFWYISMAAGGLGAAIAATVLAM